MPEAARNGIQAPYNVPLHPDLSLQGQCSEIELAGKSPQAFHTLDHQ